MAWLYVELVAYGSFANRIGCLWLDCLWDWLPVKRLPEGLVAYGSVDSRSGCQGFPLGTLQGPAGISQDPLD